MIYDDYIDYCKTYVEKYGLLTVVFMQVGDFFELYAVCNETEKLGADIYTVCDICNIQVSRKNKSVADNSRSNPLMAGFPIATIQKFIQIMVSNNYTCVLIRQTTPPPNPKREVTEIISPSTSMTAFGKDGIYLMVVYWELSLKTLNVGIAIVDLTTGKSWIYEAHGTQQDPEFAKDEVVRYTNLYQPKEVVYIGVLDDEYIEEVKAIAPATTIHYKWNEEHSKHFMKPSYQNLILEKVFGKSGIVSAIESLHLERYTIATIAYAYMVQFAYEHNEQIVKEMSSPNHLKNTKHLVLEANCIYQLNVDSSNANESPLIKILNRTSTAFGSRMFRDALFNPIIDKAELEKRYDRIEDFQKNNFYKEIIPLLQQILDLERIIRKIGMGKFQPCEWVALSASIENATKIYKLLSTPSQNQLEYIIKNYDDTLDLDECSKYNLTEIHTSIFKKGVHPKIDILTKILQEAFSYLDDIRLKITNIGSGESTLCRLDCNDREGFHLTITKKRWELAQQLCPQKILIKNGTETISWSECKVKPISATSSMLRLSHPKIDTASDTIIVNQKKMSVLNIDNYNKYQKDFYNSFQLQFKDIIQFLGEVDISCTNAKNAKEYKYTRPVINEGAISSIEAKDLRHPIIERFNNSTEYVANDISIGIEKKGMLLYGINASGKSSLMKSIGLNVIMAQSGMFVSATDCVITPYHHIFTRISGADNIYRGLSTFTVEMLELKNILNRCQENSLILGDELCAGTECVSAVAIVASGIEYLLHKSSSFVFATHLHELLEIDFIGEHPFLSVAHLHIEMDEETGKIIYDRKLKEGSGNKIYGLEVCRFLKMNDRFLKTANNIRKKMQNIPKNLIEPKTSKYNNDIYVSSCSLCGNPATETHHIKQQKDADTEGYIGNTHKDSKSNLVVLCEECHLKQHHGKQKIENVVMTSDGVEFIIVDEVEVELEQNKDIEGLKEYLHYSIQGWKYRLKTTEVWKKLIPSNYEKVFDKLKKCGGGDCIIPKEKEDIATFLQENQSLFLIFLRE